VRFYAKLFQGSEVVANRVAGVLEFEPAGDGYFGHFELPPNYHVRSGAYRLQLDDGRSADIMLPDAGSINLQEARVSFNGLGSISQVDWQDADRPMK
jgi:hypothetical protein